MNRKDDKDRMKNKGWSCKYEIDRVKNLGWAVQDEMSWDETDRRPQKQLEALQKAHSHWMRNWKIVAGRELNNKYKQFWIVYNPRSCIYLSSIINKMIDTKQHQVVYENCSNHCIKYYYII